jgi:hypothetical protein
MGGRIYGSSYFFSRFQQGFNFFQSGKIPGGRIYLKVQILVREIRAMNIPYNEIYERRSMERIGDQTWKELLQSVGKNVEAAGRMLQRKPAFTSEELSELQQTLETSAETIKRVRTSAADQV